MSAREYSNTSSLLLGPVLALVNQMAVYGANTWACGHDAHASLHVIPLLCLIVVCGAGINAFRAWRSTSRAGDAGADVESRVRFLSLLAVVVCAFSSAVIVAQWAAILVFGSCQRP